MVVHEIPSGRELWRWKNARPDRQIRYYQPSQALIAYPTQHGRSSDPWVVRDAADGTVRLSYHSSIPWRVEYCFSNNGRYVAVANPSPRKESLFLNLLKDWLPDRWLRLSRMTPHEVAVIDVQTAAVIASGEISTQAVDPRFSVRENGRSLLVTTNALGWSDRVVECWDIPFARPWGWIIGVPGGIGVSVLAWIWLRRKRRAGVS